MKTRSKLTALLASGVLILGVAGVAWASTGLLAGQQGITLSEKDKTGGDECKDADLDPGEALLHFVLTGTSDSDGSLDVDLSNPDVNPHKDNADKSSGGVLHWNVIVTGVSGDTVLEGATTSANGDNLVLSHVCFGGETTTTFESSESGTTSTETTTTDTTMTFESSESGTTSLPDTATIGDGGSSSRSDATWLLVAALGVLLGSAMVMVPGRAKSRR